MTTYSVVSCSLTFLVCNRHSDLSLVVYQQVCPICIVVVILFHPKLEYFVNSRCDKSECCCVHLAMPSKVIGTGGVE